MPKGWRKLRLATGKYREHGNSVAQTFDEFLEDQRIRLMNRLRPPLSEDAGGRDWLNGGTAFSRTREDANDGMTRRMVHQDCDQQIRGRV